MAPDKPFRQKLVPVKVGLDAEGKATPALSKKMKALGIECEPSELKVVNDGKQDQLVYEGTKAGVSLKVCRSLWITPFAVCRFLR